MMKLSHLVFLAVCMTRRLLAHGAFVTVPADVVPGRTQQSSFTTTTTTTTVLSMAVTLYGHPGTRSPLINWACHELGVDFSMGDLSQNPHPFGQIPCLTDSENVIVFESGAILQYLYQTYTAMKNSKAASAAVASWIVWANASLDPICFLETPEGKVYDTGLRQPNRRIDQLEAILRQNQKKSRDDNRNSNIMEICLIPELGFCTADVAVASYLLYVLQFFPNVLPAMLMNEWTTVVEFMQACVQRPAYAQAFGPTVQAALLERLQQATTRQQQ